MITDLGNEGEIFIFRSSFYAIINQYEFFDKKVPTFDYTQKLLIEH